MSDDLERMRQHYMSVVDEIRDTGARQERERLAGLDWLYIFAKAADADPSANFGQDRFEFNARVARIIKGQGA